MKIGYLGTGLPAALLLIPSLALGTDLLDIYNQAVNNDPQFQSAVAGNRAAQEAIPQARATLLPNAQLSADTNDNSQDTSGSTLSSGSTNFNTHGYTLSLTQPLFRWDLWVRYRQADTQVKQADAQLVAARQDLMVRVASRYFDVLQAADDLEFRQKTKEAIGRQHEQARQRFEVGLIAITDVEEAKAAYDLAVSDEITAENALDNAYEALREVTGTYDKDLAFLDEAMPLASPEPADIEEWTTTALSQNLNLLATQLAAEIAKQEIDRRFAGHYPTLDVVASRDYSANGGGTFGAFNSKTDTLGLQANLAIYSGGLVSSQTREGRHLYQQALDNLENSKRNAQLLTRQAYLGVEASVSQIQALKQALVSTETALKATEAGFQVGTRTSVDVVVAQQDTFKARRDYKAARYAYILNMLQLKQAAGIHTRDDIQAINEWLQ